MKKKYSATDSPVLPLPIFLMLLPVLIYVALSQDLSSEGHFHFFPTEGAIPARPDEPG
jgi:hypothetical protein